MGLGFGVWGLGFGVWGLGFGVGVWEVEFSVWEQRLNKRGLRCVECVRRGHMFTARAVLEAFASSLRDLGSGSLASGFGFRVPRFWFRVQGPSLLVSGSGVSG